MVYDQVARQLSCPKVCHQTFIMLINIQSATQPFLVLSRNAPPHKWGGALRDDTKNGCVADYVTLCH